MSQAPGRIGTDAAHAPSSQKGKRAAAARHGRPGVLARYRFEIGGLVVLGLAGALLFAWPFLSGSTPRRATVAPVAGGRAALPTIVPATPAPTPSGPTPVPTFQPATLTEAQAIDLIASRPANGVPFTTLRQVTDTWSAEYRGDGTWLVRGGEASWLVFEASRATLPANLAAINLETPAGRKTVR